MKPDNAVRGTFIDYRIEIGVFVDFRIIHSREVIFNVKDTFRPHLLTETTADATYLALLPDNRPIVLGVTGNLDEISGEIDLFNGYNVSGTDFNAGPARRAGIRIHDGQP